MSFVNVEMCDNCKKIATDYYAEKGWIHITGSFDEMKGRDKKGTGHSHSLSAASGQTLDFCSMKCFLEKLRKEQP